MSDSSAYAERCWPPDYNIPRRLLPAAGAALVAGLGSLSVDQLDGLACVRCHATGVLPLEGFFAGRQLFACSAQHLDDAEEVRRVHAG